MNKSKFLGKNLARLKLGKEYITIISFLITAISTLSLYLELSLPLFIICMFIALFLSWYIGYFIQKHKILDAERTTLQIPSMEAHVIIWKSIWEKVIHNKVKELIKENNEAFLKEIKEILEK